MLDPFGWTTYDVTWILPAGWQQDAVHAADEAEVWSPTALAPTSSAFEANPAAQLPPVRRIERPQLRAYRHGYAAFFPSTR